MAVKGEGKCIQWIRDHLNYQGDDCIPWPFCIDHGVGRGRIGYLGKGWWSHRLMCVMAHGEPPTPEHHAAHTCGNGHLACMNQKHLEWKTGVDNALDRAKHGTNRPRAMRRKLTLEQVEEIKRLKGVETQMALAARFGVSDNAIRNIHAGRTWSKTIRVLSADEIKAIRADGGAHSDQELADSYGVGRPVIWRIRKGQSYKWAA